MMRDSDQLDELLNVVGLVYSSAVNPAHTVEALQALNRLMRGATAQIISFDRGTGKVLSSLAGGVPQNRNEDYARHWSKLDPRLKVIAELPSGTTLGCHEVFDRKYVSRSAYYQDFLIPSGYRWVVGGAVYMPDGTTTILADLRAPDAAPFSQEEARVVRRILPHLQRAASLRTSITAQADASGSDLETFVSAFPQPCMAVDARGRVKSVSAALAPLLGILRISVVHGQLRFADGDKRSEWSRVFKYVVNSGLAGSIEVSSTDDTAWRVHITPWRFIGKAKDALEQVLQLVTFEQVLTASQPRAARLASSHRLTPAEVDVLALLSKGMRAKQIAAERRASLHTVRAQIAAILEKTGCRSQLELLAKLG